MLDLFIEKPQLMAVYLSYVLFLWFLFISVFADKEYRDQSLVLTGVWGFYCCCFIFNLFDPLSYKQMLFSLILIDSATGLILVTNRFITRYSCKLASTVAFAVLCHSMILLYKSTNSLDIKAFVFGFYYNYDELLLMAGVLQLLVSYDGGFLSGIRKTTKSFRGFTVRHRWSYGRSVHHIKNLLTRKKRESQK